MSSTLIPEETRNAASARGRILVVDDEAEIREGLETLLALEGYTVDLAVNATEGEKRLGAHAYDLVLLDMMMPDRSGLDLLREFRERDHDTPVFHGHRLRLRRVRRARAQTGRQRLRPQALE